MADQKKTSEILGKIIYFLKAIDRAVVVIFMAGMSIFILVNIYMAYPFLNYSEIISKNNIIIGAFLFIYSVRVFYFIVILFNEKFGDT